MTLKIYIGASVDITSRLAGAPAATNTTVTQFMSLTTVVVASVSGFSVGQSIVIRKQRRVIESITSLNITVSAAFDDAPQVGDVVKLFDADYTKYRLSEDTFVFTNDSQTGGFTGDDFGQEITMTDYDLTMVVPVVGNRISIFDDQIPSEPLFAGVISNIQTRSFFKSTQLLTTYEIRCNGFQWEADAVGMEEKPQVNVNLGVFIKYLMNKYTTLSEGMIDTTNSPNINYIRMANYRRFSDVCKELSNLWPGSEFVIKNSHGVGLVYFRQKTTSYANTVLSSALIEERGPGNIQINQDQEKSFNIIRLPFYQLQRREPDLFVQSTVADNAFLKTSVTLNGQPTNIDTSLLLFDDFTQPLSDSFTEDDLSNPSPPTGYIAADGFLIQGPINNVQGLQFLDASGQSPSLGDIGRVTDPSKTQPFTAEDRQTIFAKELVVNTLGEAVVLSIVDQTSISTITKTGCTTTVLKVVSNTGFLAGDRIDVNGIKAYVSSVSGGDTINLSAALAGAPGVGVAVSLHRLAKSRIKFGVYFKASGDLKYIKNGVETAFGTPRTYTASPTTYSLRLSMQCFETTITGGISSTGITVNDAANFATGDVVEIFTQGSRKDPERKVITKSGSDFTYSATVRTPKVGYRVRTLPKLVLEIKGGSFGTITGRDYTKIHQETNTWATTIVDPTPLGVMVALQKSLVATLSQFKMFNPPSITANIGGRFLQIGTQEVDSADVETDCIIRKLGSHYQLDFFPDSKTLWASGSTLELRYDEKFRIDIEEYDAEGMIALAKHRGHIVTGSEDESQLARLGGRTLDTIQILPNPITFSDALDQARALLNSVRDLATTIQIRTNTYLDTIALPGQILRSQIPGVPDTEIKQVKLEEVSGAKQYNGRSLFLMTLTAGSVDRFSDILLRRQTANVKRLVLDDGLNDDSLTRVQKASFDDLATAYDAFADFTCSSPTTYLGTTAGGPTKLMCLRIPIQ